MRKFLLMLAIALSCTFAFAQKSFNEELEDGTELRAHYEVFDVIKEKLRSDEMWTISLIDETIKMTREVSTETKDQESRTEAHQLWFRETSSVKKETYRKEVFTRQPAELKPGQVSFGAVEERRISDEALVHNWPIIYRALTNKGMLVVISKAFEPDNVQRLTVRECDGSYFFPLHEHEWEYKNGELVKHTVSTRQD